MDATRHGDAVGIYPDLGRLWSYLLDRLVRRVVAVVVAAMVLAAAAIIAA